MQTQTVKILLFTLFFALNYCGRSEVQVIDNWSVESDTLLIVIQDGANFPVIQESFVSSETILGFERDLRLQADSGSSNSAISISTTNELNLAAPGTASGGFVLQYDGVDSSMELNPSGLQQLDLTARGADSLMIRASSDHPAPVAISVSSDAARSSIYNLIVPPSDEMVDYEIKFSEFIGNADFTQVGSIQIVVEAKQDLDLIIDLVCTSGPDRVYFITPLCGSVIDFGSQCVVEKQSTEVPPQDANGNSTDTSSSDYTEETKSDNVFISLSILVQQYFSFSWNQIEVESNGHSLVHQSFDTNGNSFSRGALVSGAPALTALLSATAFAAIILL